VEFGSDFWSNVGLDLDDVYFESAAVTDGVAPGLATRQYMQKIF
jgi:hypothetical protein